MYLPSKIFYCFIFLFHILSSESQGNSIKNDKQLKSSTVRDDPENSIKYPNADKIESIRCNSSENAIKNDEMQYKTDINSTKSNRKNSKQYESREYIKTDCVKSNRMEFDVNSTEINDAMLREIEYFSKIENERDFTTHEDRNSNTDYNIKTIIVPNEACHNVTCIQFCCPFDNKLLVKGNCVEKGNGSFFLPDIYKYKNDSENKINQLLYLTVRDPCLLQGFGRRLLDSETYKFLIDGSLYYQNADTLILPTSYCFAILGRDIYDVIVCNNKNKLPIYVIACLLVSLLFLLLTFIIYSILSELRNMHGYTLRAHVASLFITYAIMYFGHQNIGLALDETFCILLAYIFNFFFLSSFFWLSVICFDIWSTFRELRSCRANVKEEKKKFMIYSIYAWGIPVILSIIYAIIDYVKIPNWIRPEMCEKKFWFSNDRAKTIYFYVPIGATVISNICFFIATTVTITHQNKRTAKKLRDSESKRNNENKQRFNMYLKLFIVMGLWTSLTFAMDTIERLVDANFLPIAVWYFFDIIYGLQGLIIFIAFVCTKKIKQLLGKQYGGQNCGLFDKIRTYNKTTVPNTTSTSTPGTVVMQDVGPSNQQLNLQTECNSTRSTKM
ncbi:G-protein coupled receptor Mth2 isoform X1 [Monomorium pharaonis]|uniref:G-protein coupled receptor Mth2 isoform X1 n=1 Tax=Monomorium pharaonis TaxID=307658 RepID=UPI001746C288|nr:G-protein coupled receptor Mth2 isoform X1 [Monomorium pharaonis]